MRNHLNRLCRACGTPLTGRQVKCCSGKCRAALSRRTRGEVLLLALLDAEAAVRKIRQVMCRDGEETA